MPNARDLVFVAVIGAIVAAPYLPHPIQLAVFGCVGVTLGVVGIRYARSTTPESQREDRDTIRRERSASPMRRVEGQLLRVPFGVHRVFSWVVAVFFLVLGVAVFAAAIAKAVSGT